MQVIGHEVEVISHEAISALCQHHFRNSDQINLSSESIESMGASAILDQFADPGQYLTWHENGGLG